MQHATMALWRSSRGDHLLAGSGNEIVCIAATTDTPGVDPVSAGVLDRTRPGPGGLSVQGDHLLAYTREGADQDASAPFCAAWALSSASPQPLWKIPVVLSNGEHVPVLVAERYILTGEMQVVELETGKIVARGEGVKPGNGGYMQAMEDVVMVRPDGTHGRIEAAFYRVGADGTVRSLNADLWRPPFGGGTTSYHHPSTYPMIDGRMFIRQGDGIYCWNLRQAKP